MSLPPGGQGTGLDPLTDEQEAALMRVHDAYGVKSWEVYSEGHMDVFLEDGDRGVIETHGGNTWGV